MEAHRHRGTKRDKTAIGILQRLTGSKIENLPQTSIMQPEQVLLMRKHKPVVVSPELLTSLEIQSKKGHQ